MHRRGRPGLISERRETARLLCILNGAEITALDAESAVIRTKRGNILNYRKRREVHGEARMLWNRVEDDDVTIASPVT